MDSKFIISKEGNRMSQIITEPALRIKVTGTCNRTCSFCNEEGDMRTIQSIKPNKEFFRCIHDLLEELQIERVMLTGGEPTIHRNLKDIIKGINCSNMSITTNGIRPVSLDEWTDFKKFGLKKVIISIHDASPQSLIQLETTQRQFGWEVQALESQKQNLIAASRAGLPIRVNVVAYHSQGQIIKVLDSLEEPQRKYKFEIRLLNDLTNIERSQADIKNICNLLEAERISSSRRAGSSNLTVMWKTKSGLQFSTKMAYCYFFEPVCGKCQIKDQCHGGFYGMRFEQRTSGYYIRLCIYKHSSDVLIPLKEFLGSNLSGQLKQLFKEDQL
jgi:molybdenum cofactor biosynthesis enzyme MoaA